MCRYYKKLFTCSHLSKIHIDRCAPACRTNLICSDASPSTTTTSASSSPSSIFSPTEPAPKNELTASLEDAPRPSHFPCIDCIEADAYAERAAQLEARMKREADAAKRAALEDARARYLEKKARAEYRAGGGTGAVATGPTGSTAASKIVAGEASTAAETAPVAEGDTVPEAKGKDRTVVDPLGKDFASKNDKDDAERKAKAKEEERKANDEEKWQVSGGRKKGGKRRGRGHGMGNLPGAMSRSAQPTRTASPGIWGRARKEGEGSANGGKKE